LQDDDDGEDETVTIATDGPYLSTITPEILFGYLLTLLIVPITLIGINCLKALDGNSNFSPQPLKLGKVDE
jgi:hypothetical protein